jgi:hypothetical protein
MTTITCANHPDRLAMGYCAGCGKALCSSCLVRLSTGNYCQVCAETPDHRPPAGRRRTRTWLWVGLAALVTLVLLLLRSL